MFSNSSHSNDDSVVQTIPGTTLHTLQSVQPATSTDGSGAMYSALEVLHMKLSPNPLPPTPPSSEISNLYLEPNIPATCAEDLWWSSPLIPTRDLVQSSVEQEAFLPHVMDGNGGVLGESLARLNAYLIGVSRNSLQDTLSSLQKCLAIVCKCVASVNNSEIDAYLGSPSASAFFPLRKQRLTPTEAMMCIHTIQLAMACYVKLREDESKDLNAYKDLLNAYITRDIQMCRSLAKRLSFWRSGMKYPNRQPETHHEYEAYAMLSIMEESFKVMSLDISPSMTDRFQLG